MVEVSHRYLGWRGRPNKAEAQGKGKGNPMGSRRTLLISCIAGGADTGLDGRQE